MRTFAAALIAACGLAIASAPVATASDFVGTLVVAKKPKGCKRVNYVEKGLPYEIVLQPDKKGKRIESFKVTFEDTLISGVVKPTEQQAGREDVMEIYGIIGAKTAHYDVTLRTTNYSTARLTSSTDFASLDGEIEGFDGRPACTIGFSVVLTRS